MSAYIRFPLSGSFALPAIQAQNIRLIQRTHNAKGITIYKDRVILFYTVLGMATTGLFLWGLVLVWLNGGKDFYFDFPFGVRILFIVIGLIIFGAIFHGCMALIDRLAKYIFRNINMHK
jgi:hypothetical protein